MKTSPKAEMLWPALPQRPEQVGEQAESAGPTSPN